MGVSSLDKTYTIEQDTVLNAGPAGQTPTLGPPPSGPVDPDYLVEDYTLDRDETDLPAPIPTGNMSGATYDSQTDRFQLIQNNTSDGHEVTLETNQDITPIRALEFNHSGGFQDTECIEILLDKTTVAVGSENNTTYVITIHDWIRGDIDVSFPAYKQRLTVADKPVGSENNSGLEGIAYNSALEANGVMYAAGEGEQPLTDKRLFRCIMPAIDNVDYRFDDPEFTVVEILNFNDRWESAVGAFDLSDLCLAPNGHLLIISHQGQKVYQIDVEDLFTNKNGAPNEFDPIEIVSELTLPAGNQYEGLALDSEKQMLIISEPNLYFTYAPPAVVAPVIDSLPVIQDIALGNTFILNPTLSEVTDVFWFKEYGPDGMAVDQETGQVVWDTTGLDRGQGVAFAIGANNSAGEDIKWSMIHVDNTGTSKGRIAGQFQADLAITLSPYMRIASAEINGGDTLVLPSGVREVSVTADESYENAFNIAGSDYSGGIATQYTTICGEDPENTIIDGSAHDAIPRQKKAIQLDVGTHSQYIKMMGFECRGVERQGFISSVSHTIAELIVVGDNGHAQTPTNYVEAELAYSSVAGLYQQGDHAVIDSCFAYGQFRYGLQIGNPQEFALFHRSVVRGDDYHGDQPRGLLTNYTVKNVGFYNNWGLDADQEDFSPFYKNGAGAISLPATGNETFPEFIEHRCNGIINCQMGVTVNDAKTADVAQFSHIVSYNTTTQIAPQTGIANSMFITSDDAAFYGNCSIDRIDSVGIDYGSPATGGGVRNGSSSRGMTVNDSILSNFGWSGTDTINIGDMFVGTGGMFPSSADNNNVFNFKGIIEGPISNWTVTNTQTTDPKANGWDYPPRIEEGSPLDIDSIGATILFFQAPNLKMQGDPGWNTPTTVPCWPIPAEKMFAAKARTYSKTGIPTRSTVPGGLDFGTGNLDGNRGGSVVTESYSEYIWGQFGRTVPPLRVSAKQTDDGEVTIRIGKYRSSRGDSITKFNIYNKLDLVNPVAVISGSTLKKKISGLANDTYTFVVRAVDATKLSAYDANESGESGNSYDMIVTVI